jgi:hypothetical protein
LYFSRPSEMAMDCSSVEGSINQASVSWAISDFDPSWSSMAIGLYFAP